MRCEKYAGGCEVTDEFCSKRYKKAVDIPNGEYEACKDCERGKECYARLGFNPRELRPCRKCGTKCYGDLCVVCARKNAESRGGDNMPAVTSSKICKICGKEYKPTSNVQKFCPECASEHKKDMQKRSNEKRKRKYRVNPIRPVSPILEKSNGNLNILQKLISERNRIDEAIKTIEQYVGIE